ncbi:MAG: hypothetical protein ABIP57_01765 [Jatrophihabitantaceae bacterium]
MPQVHHLVSIRDPLGRESLSRVEDVDDPVLVLARPLDLLVEHEFGIGEPVLVSWQAPNGVTTAPTELLESQLHGPLGLWVVRVNGPLRIAQRRRFVRVPATGPVRLTIGEPDDEQAPEQIAGLLCSVSEGSVRCSIEQCAAELLAPDIGTTASFEFGRQDFTLPSQLLRVEPCRRDRARVEAILQFQIDEDDAGALRRAVFAAQLRIRNADN